MGFGYFKLAMFSLLFLWLVSACQNPIKHSRKTFSFKDTIEIRNFTTITSEDRTMSIRMDSVLNDSRCPSGSDCIWAGNASVRILFGLPGKTDTLILNTVNNHSLKNDTIVEGYHIVLTDLLPYPAAGSSISQREYEAGILIFPE